MQRPTWTVLTLGAALTGLGVAGTGLALADDGTAARADLRPITVGAADGSAPAPLAVAGHPAPAGSADSPFDSTGDSPYDSPGDSPFDGPGDPSADTASESADPPRGADDSADPSVDSPYAGDDSADDTA